MSEILLIDHSEAYDEVDKKRFASGMNRVFTELRPGHKLEIYLIKENANNLAAVFSACVPGCESEIEPNTNNWSTVCSSLRTQQDKRQFQIAFVSIMRRLVNSSKSTEGTAILETLGQLGVQYRDIPDRITRITIFSDMLEFSDQNRAINGFDRKDSAKLLSRARNVVQETAPFKDTSVVIFGIGKRLGQERLIKEKSLEEAMLPREAAKAIRDFWQDFFTDVLKTPPENLVMTLNY